MGTKLRLFRGSKTKRPAGPVRDRVIFVSHEATLTGAPKIILNILREFHEKCDIQCETILHNGGHLVGEFARYSETIDCLDIPRKPGEMLQKRIRRIVNREKGNPPILAVCNSMESRFISQELASHGIPVVALVHELPSSYTEQDYQQVYQDSSKIIFPVEAVRSATDQKLPLPSGLATVLPQGLLTPGFGSSTNREESVRAIRDELGLPQDSFVVLGCGTLDLRKGIDHFATVARETCKRDNSRPVHFVWVGEGPRWTHSPYHYVQLDLEKSKAKHQVHFIGERANVEPYFVGADAFLMSSRVDPFPCVIHEAMSVGLPVITFAESGGAPEAVAGGAGFVVPYADYDHAANIIRLLATQPEVAAGIRDRSRRRVEEKYQFSDYADKIIDLCETEVRRNLRKQPNPPQLRAVA